jgi:3-oxoacyl-(acyl-carrier-protein) synthase/malonyl CoA-acyl carrier protein transacylase
MDGQGDHCGPVAIIGVACRFPGASDPTGFHRLTLAGHRLFRPVAGWPGGELHAALLDDWAPSPVSAEDPQDTAPVRKLAAEMTALALSDAGLREAAGRSRTGLFVASSTPGLSDSVREELGFATDVPYPRAAYLSSLHAVVAAAQALQAGDLDLAVAGGAELGLDPVWLALQVRAGALGTSQMRVYAANPAGLLPGDGCGVVVLARAADARTADVPVYAEIAGWTSEPVRSAGATGAIGATGAGSVPPPDGPTALRAYLRAGVDPADIQLIEGQGTGIAAADLAELTAFTRLRRGAGTAAALGAVSAGIGYARAAAGVASLIKASLAMVAGTIPPGTGCERPHPLIESGDALLRLPGQPEPWPDGNAGAGRTRLAAVNSLGTGEADGLAAMYGLTGAREVEGVHLVLRRDAGSGRAGRRRRTAEGEEAASPSRIARPPQAPAPPAGGITERLQPPVSPPAGITAPPHHPGPPPAGITASPHTPGLPAGITERLQTPVSPPAGITAPPHHPGPPPAGIAASPDTSGPPPAGSTELRQAPAPPTAPIIESPGTLIASPFGSADPRNKPVPLPIRATWAVRESAPDPSVFALCGGDPGELAGRLDAIAASVEGLAEAELREVARHLAFGVLGAGDREAPVRMALTAATPGQLADRARSAARLLRAGGPAAAADPGIHVSAGATGRVVVLFGGLTGSGLTYSALLAASLAALRTVERLGVRPGAGVGYSLGELSGLAWADCVPAAEAARLAAQCDQVLRGCACAPAAMVRIAADAETARGLCAPDRLHVAAYEGPRTHVLAGSTAAVRELSRRAAALGIAADVLPGMHALHSPAMTGCTVPLRGVFAGTRFAPPRRRLVSTITGRLVMPGDDLAEQMSRQLSAPVLFTQAMTLAAGEADLIVVAGPDAGLAALAGECCDVPAVAVSGTAPAGPADLARNTPAAVVAALFAAGAITDLAPFMAGPGPAAVLARHRIPRMREAEPPGRPHEGASRDPEPGRHHASASRDPEPGRHHDGAGGDPPPKRHCESASGDPEPGRHHEGAGQDPEPRTTARSGL